MEAPTLDRRLVAILAADVEGYSREWLGRGGGTRQALHRAVVDHLIGEFRGRIANTAGDSVLAEFASVVDTVRCAVRYPGGDCGTQRRVIGRERMRFRIGINVGDVMVKDGDIFGDGVNIAARLQTTGGTGRHLRLARGARPYPPSGLPFRFEDLGEQMVKNIERPVRAFRVTSDDLVRPTLPTTRPLATTPPIRSCSTLRCGRARPANENA